LREAFHYDSQHKLEYAILMPWIGGQTCFDVLQQARKCQFLTIDLSIRACCLFLQIISGIEAAKAAHTDISPSDVIVDIHNDRVELLDL
jgi:serine/threonine protein kinase